MNEIYIVKGTRGDYSDTRIWDVEAFTVRAEAEKFCEELSQLARRYDPYGWEENSEVVAQEVFKQIKVLDPNFEIWYTDTDYGVSNVRLTDQKGAALEHRRPDTTTPKTARADSSANVGAFLCEPVRYLSARESQVQGAYHDYANDFSRGSRLHA